MTVKKIFPIGYCKGVIDAIEMAKRIKIEHPKENVFVFGMIVHNEEVVEELSKLNIISLDISKIDPLKRLDEFQKGDIVIFTAHGHPEAYDEILKKKNISYYDAVCSRVKQNMSLIQEEVKNNEVIYIGKKGHPETDACLSISNKVHLYDIKEGIRWEDVNSDHPLIANQTTLSFLELSSVHEDIKKHYPKANFLSEICSATKLRQKAISTLNENIDLLLVIGSKKSSNTTKLFELGKKNPHIKEVLQINNEDDIKNIDFKNKELIYLCSGTSTSPSCIRKIETILKGE